MQKILVRSPNWIGDQVLAYPFYYYLRKLYPQARITAVGPAWIESIQFLDLVNEVHVLQRPLGSGVFAKLRALEQEASLLRSAGRWDLAVSLPNSLSAAWLMFRSGSRERVCYNTDGRGLLLTRRQDWQDDRVSHRAVDYVRLLPLSLNEIEGVRHFWGLPPENELDPGIPGVVEPFQPQKSWLRAQPIQSPLKDYWVLAPGSAAESRRWPVSRFAELARKVRDSTGLCGLIVGGPKEASLALQLTEDRSLGLRDLTGQGTVADLWAVFQGARFTVANDSGLAHVAALCGSPTQVVWGAGNPQRTTPLGPGRVRVAFQPLDCWPCEKNSCALPSPRKLECLQGLSSEMIWNEVRNGLKLQ
jgi:heptosyltransferase-2